MFKVGRFFLFLGLVGCSLVPAGFECPEFIHLNDVLSGWGMPAFYNELSFIRKNSKDVSDYWHFLESFKLMANSEGFIQYNLVEEAVNKRISELAKSAFPEHMSGVVKTNITPCEKKHFRWIAYNQIATYQPLADISNSDPDLFSAVVRGVGSSLHFGYVKKSIIDAAITIYRLKRWFTRTTGGASGRLFSWLKSFITSRQDKDKIQENLFNFAPSAPSASSDEPAPYSDY